MAEFTPITTQEAFDEAIRDRLARQNAKHENEVAALNAKLSETTAALEAANTTLAEHETKYADFGSMSEKIASLTAKVNEYETASAKKEIAKQFNLPEAFYNRLQGSTEEEWKADAQALAALMPPSQPAAAPLSNPEPRMSSDREAQKTAALKEMLKSLQGD